MWITEDFCEKCPPHTHISNQNPCTTSTRAILGASVGYTFLQFWSFLSIHREYSVFRYTVSWNWGKSLCCCQGNDAAHSSRTLKTKNAVNPQGINKIKCTFNCHHLSKMGLLLYVNPYTVLKHVWLSKKEGVGTVQLLRINLIKHDSAVYWASNTHQAVLIQLALYSRPPGNWSTGARFCTNPLFIIYLK